MAENDSKRDKKIEERRNKLRERSAARANPGSPLAQAEARKKARKVKRQQVALRIRGYRIKPRFVLILAGLIIALWVISRIVSTVSTSTNVFLTDEGFKHADKFEYCIPLNGIDVSAHQGEDIKWKKVKTSGADFVFIRAGYRSADDGTLHIDETFEKNIKKAKKAGIMIGAYFYSQALTPDEAREEADFLLELVKPYEISMPLVIDFEIYPEGRLEKKIQAGELFASSLYHEIALAFCRRVEDAGYESAVYANLDMLTHYMDATLLDDEADIWLARYNKTADLNADYMYWQCQDDAKVGGIEGKVDHDFWYVEPNKVYKTRGAGIREKNRISVSNCHISFQRSVTKLRGNRAIPKLGITYEGKGLREGTDYILSYVCNTKPGTGYIILRGIGKYKNWMMVPFIIE